MENYLTSITNLTTVAPSGGVSSQLIGYLCVVVASLLFGSNLVPVKKFETGDGVFFQWMYCIAIWLTGFIVHAVRNFPTFYPIAMIGGFLWCTGNLMTVPIIKTIGLGQGILIWASFNLISGWTSGRFGWFTMKPQVPMNSAMNYAGVTLCLVSAFVYMFMKTDPQTVVKQANSSRIDDEPVTSRRIDDEPVTTRRIDDEPVTSRRIDDDVPVTTRRIDDDVPVTDDDEPLSPQSPEQIHEPPAEIHEPPAEIHEPPAEKIIFERLQPVPKRVLGTVMAVVDGILYGMNFAPVIAYKDNHPTASQNGLDYVFAHYTGLVVSSTGYMIIYGLVMRNQPRIYNRAVLPGLLSGFMCGVAEIVWFVANDTLSETISFPLITTCPSMIGALWGIFFREITGKRNLLILMVAFVIAIAGSVLTGLSKPGKGVTNTTYVF